MATVSIHQVENPADLLCQYPGQNGIQPVELSLDTRTGALRCDYDPNIGGGSTFAHMHRLVLSAPIPCLTANAANELMAEVAPIAQRVLDGADEQWDGNNHVGVFTDDANAAWDEIAELCAAQEESLQTVTSWDISDWFSEGEADTIETFGITSNTTDAELQAMAEAESARATRESADGGYELLDATAVCGYLTELRDELRESIREQLPHAAAAIEEAVARRDEIMRKIRSWKVETDTLRLLGTLAGVSHTEAGRIVNSGSDKQ